MTKDPACPWCGKPFLLKEIAGRTIAKRLADAFRAARRAWKESGDVLAICPNSYCVVVPYGQFASREDAVAALNGRP